MEEKYLRVMCKSNLLEEENYGREEEVGGRNFD